MRQMLIGIGLMVLAQPATGQGTDAQGFDLYGQINRGILSFDDGASRDAYPFVDNSKSVSRIGATFDQPLSNDWHFQMRGELALRKKETNHISQSDPDQEDYKLDKSEIRKIEILFRHDDLGTFTIGQGAMSADGFTGLDLSLTTVVAGTPVQDAAGGFYFTDKKGELTKRRIKQAYRSLGSSRQLRVRYDSPVRNGLRFAVAAGQEVLHDHDDQKYADASLRYDGEHRDWRLRAGGALRWIEERPNVFIASGSALHRPTGLNYTLATGHEAAGGHYVYGKAGLLKNWFRKTGLTAFSVDTYYGENMAGQDGTSWSYGIAAVQKVKAAKVDIYTLLRRYDHDASGQSYQPATAFLTGLRWQF